MKNILGFSNNKNIDSIKNEFKHVKKLKYELELKKIQLINNSINNYYSEMKELQN